MKKKYKLCKLYTSSWGFLSVLYLMVFLKDPSNRIVFYVFLIIFITFGIKSVIRKQYIE